MGNLSDCYLAHYRTAVEAYAVETFEHENVVKLL